ncbi:MAG: hypothetical protein JW928_01055 [Candidatus Aureabacteria bacterium]|nr:hypothetical protein [Candidatus Auribacterota bacterium]
MRLKMFLFSAILLIMFQLAGYSQENSEPHLISPVPDPADTKTVQAEKNQDAMKYHQPKGPDENTSFMNNSSEDSQKLITLELKDIDIVEVLKILSKKGDLNIIIGQNVKGRITLFLKDVTVWNALKNVFEIAGLAYIKKGDVYQIITDRDYLQLYGREFFDNREMKIIALHNANANDALGSVKGMMSKIGTINVDQRTNSLIVVDAKENIAIIEKAIEDLDRPLYTEVYALQYLSITQAEEIIKGILSAKGRYQKDAATNKIILTDIYGNIEKITQVIKEYDVAPSIETKVYKLNYASYEKVEAKIKELLTPNVGKISSDERTNTLVVMDLPSNIRKIDEIVQAYDEKIPEVLIEAKIVQVQLNDKFQYGINWNYVFESVAENLDFDVLSAFELAQKTASETTDEDEETPSEEETSFADGITSFSEGGARIVISGKLNENDFDAVINALRTVGDAKVLSSPRIMVVDGEQAKIQVATREAYVTDTVSQGQSTTTTAENVTFIDVGVILTVTPKINDEGFILMKIKPEVSAVEDTIRTSQGNTIPIVATQEAETSVLVKDGVTIVMGGLIEELAIDDTRKVPFLGDIPILGFPFRKKVSRTRKNELVLFLTPRIVGGDKNFYESPEYAISRDAEELQGYETPDYYVDPVDKGKRYLKKEFLRE